MDANERRPITLEAFLKTITAPQADPRTRGWSPNWKNEQPTVRISAECVITTDDQD